MKTGFTDVLQTLFVVAVQQSLTNNLFFSEDNSYCKNCKLVLIMETVDLIEFVEFPNRRVLRDRNNPFEFYNEEEFESRYRIRKETAQALLQLLSTDLNHVSSKNNCIPPILQLAVALRFFATGHFQTTDGDLVGVSQPSVCRIIHRVSAAIARRRRRFIKFPAATNLQIFKEKFSLVGGMPGVIGCIDCTHIPIVSPGGEDAELYRNRKGFFSINVQATCDPDLFLQTLYADGQGRHTTPAFLTTVDHVQCLKVIWLMEYC